MQSGKKRHSFDVMGLLTQHNKRWSLSGYQENKIVYSQGDKADLVFYVHTAKLKSLSPPRLERKPSSQFGADEFCGEGAMTGTPLRLETTTTMSPCAIIRMETKTLVLLLHENEKFSDYFLHHLLARTARVEADLVDQLFNSSEMRLARALLLLANYGNDLGQEPLPGANEETLAELIGTTRSRVNVFMNKSKVGLDQIQRQA